MKKFFLFLFLFSVAFSPLHAFAGGCDVNASITASGPTTFCSNDSISLTANTAASYDWNNGETTQSIWVDQSGIYTVTVTDSTGCSDFSGFTFVNVLDAPDATIFSEQLPPYCEGDEVTLFTLNLFGDFLWSTGETSQTISITQSGNYSVVVTNFTGCSDSASFPAIFLPAPFLNVNADGSTSLCQGQDVELSVAFGFGLDLLWSPNGETSSAINVSEAGTYNVTATNFFGCSATSQDFVITVTPIPTAYAGEDTVICAPDSLVLSATGGTEYYWANVGEGDSISVFAAYGDNHYFVQVRNPGCSIYANDTVLVQVGGDVVADFSVVPALLGDETVFTDLSTGSIISWDWNLGNGSASSLQNPTATYLAEDSFTVVLIITDPYGCSDTAQHSFFIQQVITIPNVLTPNGDGVNDNFYIANAGDGGFAFSVYNRWGQMVFETNAQEVRWSGLTTAGAVLPGGTYFYILIQDLEEGEKPVVQKGFITLMLQRLN